MQNRDDAIQALLTRNVEEVIDRKHLGAALTSGKKLRVKHGIDPTGEQIHIGRAVILWKLKEFQDLGHKIVLIIGDFTAQIGDPSDKLHKRPFLSPAEIKKNLKTYLPQIGKVLDLKKAEIRYNGEWLRKLNLQEISRLAELFSIQQMVARHNFRDRIKKGEEVSLRETLYPLMQGYDSVAVKADVELGGTDQLFNLKAGRRVQEAYGARPQDIMMLKMLLGTDGRKMSTSWGNVVNVADPSREQFGRIMSMRDEMIPEYLALATTLPAEIVRELADAYEDRTQNPKLIKERIAFEVVRLYHGDAAAEKAGKEFNELFSRGGVDAELATLSLKGKRIAAEDLVMLSTAARSKSEARRLVAQGALYINGAQKSDPHEVLSFAGGEVIRIGKHRFFRVK